jgi:hypothetical protein
VQSQAGLASKSDRGEGLEDDGLERGPFIKSESLKMILSKGRVHWQLFHLILHLHLLHLAIIHHILHTIVLPLFWVEFKMLSFTSYPPLSANRREAICQGRLSSHQY